MFLIILQQEKEWSPSRPDLNSGKGKVQTRDVRRSRQLLMMTLCPRGAAVIIRNSKQKRQNKTFRPGKVSEESEIDLCNIRQGQIKLKFRPKWSTFQIESGLA